jgi:penicillin-binding protein 2
MKIKVFIEKLFAKILHQEDNHLSEVDMSKLRPQKSNYFLEPKKKKWYLKWIVFFSSRYRILNLFFIIFAIMIFINTFYLQIGQAHLDGEIRNTVGISRERIIKAPRGNIFDRYGIPLAVSENINVIYYCHTNLDNQRLNKTLLDLARFLETNEVSYSDPLTQYIAINPIRFNKESWEVLAWQTHRGTFGLLRADPNKQILYSDLKYVKDDPAQFFNYLRRTLYDIDLSYSMEDAFRIMKLRTAIYFDRWSYFNGKPIEIARNVQPEIISFLEEQNFRFTGVLSAMESERRYLPDAKYLGHVIGYIGAISSAQYNELQNSGYTLSDTVGKTGVELSAERYLKGIDGIRPYNILTAFPEEEIYFPEDAGKEPIPGNDILLTIDIRLQKIAVDSLQVNIEYIKSNPRDQNKGDADSGSVVVMDVNTGEVLVMASYPGYDPNDFILAPYYDENMKNMLDVLNNTKDKPMLNRAIMEIYAPGSTFKPITAVAALQEGVSTLQHCGGTEMIGEWRFRCLEYPSRGHGNLNLTRGMATSCNIYFHKLGVLTGIDNLNKWMKYFGLGEFTGIDLPSEERGIRSNRETKKILRQNPYDQIWFPADTAQTAIGQFDNKFTVLQMARYTAALSNGFLVTPHVIREITKSDGTIIKTGYANPIPIPVHPSTIQTVKEAMIAVSKDREGTARRVFSDFPITIAAKTGTAETGHEDISSSNALFICYAPADHPQIAIAQIVEKGVWGSNTMSITHDLLNAYFGLNNKIEYEIIEFPSLD